MFFLVPRITLVLLLVFVALSRIRVLRRRHFLPRPPFVQRVATNLGRRAGQRSAQRLGRSTGSGPGDQGDPGGRQESG